MSRKDGRFEKGNTIGKETRFKPDNTISSKYRPDYAAQMLEWFRARADGRDYPTFELFADSIDVTDDTLKNWCENHPRFRNAYTRCQNIQKGVLLRGGVLDVFNANIVKFVAENCHGMREKTETENSVTFRLETSDEIDEESN